VPTARCRSQSSPAAASMPMRPASSSPSTASSSISPPKTDSSRAVRSSSRTTPNGVTSGMFLRHFLFFSALLTILEPQSASASRTQQHFSIINTQWRDAQVCFFDVFSFHFTLLTILGLHRTSSRTLPSTTPPTRLGFPRAHSACSWCSALHLKGNSFVSRTTASSTATVRQSLATAAHPSSLRRSKSTSGLRQDQALLRVQAGYSISGRPIRPSLEGPARVHLKRPDEVQRQETSPLPKASTWWEDIIPIFVHQARLTHCHLEGPHGLCHRCPWRRHGCHDCLDERSGHSLRCHCRDQRSPR
jgi:hypothetical protein